MSQIRQFLKFLITPDDGFNDKIFELEHATPDQIGSGLTHPEIYQKWYQQNTSLRLKGNFPADDTKRLEKISLILQNLNGFVNENLHNLNAQQIKNINLLLNQLDVFVREASNVIHSHNSYVEFRVSPAKTRKVFPAAQNHRVNSFLGVIQNMQSKQKEAGEFLVQIQSALGGETPKVEKAARLQNGLANGRL